MHHKVGVAADRAGEVRVVLAGQGEVAHQLRAVLGLAQGLEHRHVHRVLTRLTADLFKKVLQLVAAGLLGDVKTRHPGKILQPRPRVLLGIRVRAANHRHIDVRKRAGRGLVRFHHAHLDDGVGERVVFGLGVDHAAGFIEHQLHRRQAQHNHPVGKATLADDAGQLVHQLAGGDDLPRILGLFLGVLARFFQVVLDQGLGFQIRQPLGALDHAAAKALAQHLALLVIDNEAALGIAVHAFHQRAHAVAQHLGQHGDHPARQVGAVAPAISLFVQLAAGLDISRHVGDVHAQLVGRTTRESRLFQLGGGHLDPLQADRVVVVLGIGRVDRADRLAGQVFAVFGDLLGQLGGGLAGLFHHLLGEVLVQAKGPHGRQRLDVRQARLAQHLGDHALGVRPAIVGENRQVQHHLVAHLGVLAFDVADQHRGAEHPTVDHHAKLLALLNQRARVRLLGPLQHLGDVANERALAAAVVAPALLTDHLGLHPVAAHRLAQLAGGNKQIPVFGGVFGGQKAKTLFVAPQGADHRVPGRGQRDRVLSAGHHAAVAHQTVNRLGKGIAVRIRDLHRLAKLIHRAGLVMPTGDVLKNAGFLLFNHGVVWLRARLKASGGAESF